MNGLLGRAGLGRLISFTALVVGHGEFIRFWEDVSSGESSFASFFPIGCWALYFSYPIC